VSQGSGDRPITLFEFEGAARASMAPADFVEVAGAPPGNLTARRTRAAWDALALRPRVFPGAASPDLAVTVLGRRLEVPFMLAPAGYHTRAHPDGELASARAATAAGSLLVISANPGHPIEDVARAANGPLWLQTYIHRDRQRTMDAIRSAERSGCTAICLTLDAHWPAKREGRIQARSAKSAPLTAGPPATFFAPEMSDARIAPKAAGERERLRVVGDPGKTWADPSATWSDLDWLRGLTRLPIVCKGIMTAEDAELCVAHGAAGILVSNHGARMDNTLATIEVLPEIVRAVNGRVEVYLDGGVRRGADVVKALALGARAVLFGRPIFWGLAYGGERGLLDLLDILREEVEITMMLTGRPTLASLDPSMVTTMPELPPAYEWP
jgi:4-hydroxymandelate oxidase